MGSYLNGEKQDLKHLVWIDPKYENEENQSYIHNMKSLGFSNIKTFANTEEGINYIKNIQFESTKIILSGWLYIEFIKQFKESMKNLCIIPKIAIFTGNKNKFLEYNKTHKDNMEILNNNFFVYGGINESYEQIKEFLMNKKINEGAQLININEDDEIKSTLGTIHNKENLTDNKNIQLTFEYIDCIEKLELPLLYQSLINLTKIDNIEKYNKYLYSNYSKENNLIELLNDINKVSNIPIELLCKYYIRLYTMDSNFYKDINYNLRNRKKENYLPFIRVLYEGLKLTALKTASNKELYRGSKISLEEIEKIKDY